MISAYLQKTNRHTSWVSGKGIRHDIINQIITIPINTLDLKYSTTIRSSRRAELNHVIDLRALSRHPLLFSPKVGIRKAIPH